MCQKGDLWFSNMFKNSVKLTKVIVPIPMNGPKTFNALSKTTQTQALEFYSTNINKSYHTRFRRGVSPVKVPASHSACDNHLLIGQNELRGPDQPDDVEPEHVPYPRLVRKIHLREHYNPHSYVRLVKSTFSLNFTKTFPKWIWVLFQLFLRQSW